MAMSVSNSARLARHLLNYRVVEMIWMAGFVGDGDGDG
ncbi:predicted protein [Sclerotinia sclerotiorum 1980 UF-70]|uniref:Uncharacterized protein n=1 Tax=Sclerotinia sclerotiorum (strain ATCC 18683 / 1980 / Ss-1) TaxID=665079 RepID=A7F739_SCLS1|nr:predicted protein [Sclerotinia sclerotiorum 1980 UF-70]EDN98560.1 predicted protein [Sclerotinia sclerotiorum 1980 UF-70]